MNFFNLDKIDGNLDETMAGLEISPFVRIKCCFSHDIERIKY